MKPAQPSRQPAAWPDAAPAANPAARRRAIRPADHANGPALPRLWSALLSARVLIALVILGLHLVMDRSGRPVEPWVLGICVAYVALTLLARMMAGSGTQEQSREAHWHYAVAVDVVFVMALHWQQAADIRYTPLLVLPVLLAAIMGSRPLALGTAALVTLLLLGHAAWAAGAAGWAHTAHIAEAGLTGAGLLILAWLGSQLAGRLRREESAARRSRAEAQTQSLVNSLVIEALPEGVLVVDAAQRVRAANPAARALLTAQPASLPAQFGLDADPGWAPLLALARRSFTGVPIEATQIALGGGGDDAHQVLVRAQRTSAPGRDGASLCVMFLQDLQQIEERISTEKFAALGRMSTAVAHEIRNPLAAISQANALLEEDLRAPEQQRLAAMVRQNAQRLGRIVDDILNATRAQGLDSAGRPQLLPLDDEVAAHCREWVAQHGSMATRLQLTLQAPGARVRFEREHLRRILINLLDNAARYASPHPGTLQVGTRAPRDGAATLSVWSDGPPLPAAVRQHLFEPFSSSRSRSSGLGLFICRELCERHGAGIAYERVARPLQGRQVDGNDFSIRFAPAGHAASSTPAQQLAVS